MGKLAVYPISEIFKVSSGMRGCGLMGSILLITVISIFKYRFIQVLFLNYRNQFVTQYITWIYGERFQRTLSSLSTHDQLVLVANFLKVITTDGSHQLWEHKSHTEACLANMEAGASLECWFW